MKYIVFALAILATSAQAGPRVDLYTGLEDASIWRGLGFLWNDSKPRDEFGFSLDCYKWRNKECKRY